MSLNHLETGLLNDFFSALAKLIALFCKENLAELLENKKKHEYKKFYYSLIK